MYEDNKQKNQKKKKRRTDNAKPTSTVPNKMDGVLKTPLAFFNRQNKHASKINHECRMCSVAADDNEAYIGYSCGPPLSIHTDNRMYIFNFDKLPN